MSVPEIKINAGEKIADKYTVKKKLGEGSCGQVYLVADKNENLLAMKVEPRMKNRDEEILKMEIYVLKKLQASKHVCRFYCSGTTPQYSFVVMSLLGQELADLRRKCNNRRMCASTVLRISIQVVNGIEDMHKVGFVHRDIKPTNLALGNKLKHAVFIFDFGLARQIMLPDKSGKLTLREPRKRVSFRGTVRYCSLNVHLAKEQGRHDDLWGILFSMIELATGTLPWKGSNRKDAEKIKAVCTEKQLLKGVPKALHCMYKHLLTLTYNDEPNYTMLKGVIAKEIKSKKVSMTDPYDWEKGFVGAPATPVAPVTKDTIKDVNVEIDKGGDNDTSKDVDENAQSATSEMSNNEASINDYDIENTLENVADVKGSFRETDRNDKS